MEGRICVRLRKRDVRDSHTKTFFEDQRFAREMSETGQRKKKQEKTKKSKKL
jgi:hypothetical protein